MLSMYICNLQIQDDTKRMKLKRPLKHVKLSQMQFFYWDELTDDQESDKMGGDNPPIFYGQTND